MSNSALHSSLLLLLHLLAVDLTGARIPDVVVKPWEDFFIQFHLTKGCQNSYGEDRSNVSRTHRFHQFQLRLIAGELREKEKKLSVSDVSPVFSFDKHKEEFPKDGNKVLYNMANRKTAFCELFEGNVGVSVCDPKHLKFLLFEPIGKSQFHFKYSRIEIVTPLSDQPIEFKLSNTCECKDFVSSACTTRRAVLFSRSKRLGHVAVEELETTWKKPDNRVITFDNECAGTCKKGQ